MPDPQRDIAPIIEPVAQIAEPVGLNYTLPIALVLAGLILIAFTIWQWRRRRPLKELNKIAKVSDPIKAADALAALVKRYSITLSAECQNDLERLRFSPPTVDADETLLRLCREAQSFLQTR